MSESSRSINHKLNELLGKNPSTKNKLDATTALNYANILKTNILGKDKQEKVNSIVVLAKLLDCLVGSETISDDFSSILDHVLFATLFSIVSSYMSTETYKAILKISVILISASIFPPKNQSFDKFLPLYESLIDYLYVIDIITQKLYLQDNKITFNSIKLVTELIDRAITFEYSGIITIAARLKHVTFFSTVGNLIETEDQTILDAIDDLKVSYYNLNENLYHTNFDLSIKSHQIMLNNLFAQLEVSLNENGTPASPEEYIRAGFTANPRKFVVDSYSLLLAMDLKIFLKDPNFTFKKRYHEELMMKTHGHTFPMSLFIEKCTDMWIDIMHESEDYPFIFHAILSWELMIYTTMNNCLILWQETKAQLENLDDVTKIMDLLKANIDNFELELSKQNKSIEECLDTACNKTGNDMRHVQVKKINNEHSERWKSRLTQFDRELAKEVMDFVAEQRVIQLLKGSWVFTEDHGEQMLKTRDAKKPGTFVYYYITLSPNRRQVYYKEYLDKPLSNPSYEELEEKFVNISEISRFESTKVGAQIGENDKKKNSMLISVKGTISYEKITLLNAAGKKLLSFYTDTEVNKYVWLDGLKMLRGMNEPGQLSKETAKQINSLIDIRRTTQLLALEREKALEIDLTENDDENEFYDLSELTNVTKGFHYREKLL